MAVRVFYNTKSMQQAVENLTKESLRELGRVIPEELVKAADKYSWVTNNRGGVRNPNIYDVDFYGGKRPYVTVLYNNSLIRPAPGSDIPANREEDESNKKWIHTSPMGFGESPYNMLDIVTKGKGGNMARFGVNNPTHEPRDFWHDVVDNQRKMRELCKKTLLNAGLPIA